jgi:hypothetical protein
MKDIKNNVWIPNVGEGIFIIETNEWYIVKRLLTLNSWPIYTPSLEDEDNAIIGVEVINNAGRKLKYRLDEIRQETFCQYLKRPTGVGRTPWTKVIIMSMIMIFGHITSIITWNENGWVGTLLLIITLIVWFYSTWRNYKNINQ